jgi:hypothetical protein
MAQNPRKLVQGIGGALLLTAAYILCLAVCVRTFGDSAAIMSVAAVYLTGIALDPWYPHLVALAPSRRPCRPGRRPVGCQVRR